MKGYIFQDSIQLDPLFLSKKIFIFQISSAMAGGSGGCSLQIKGQMAPPGVDVVTQQSDGGGSLEDLLA